MAESVFFFFSNKIIVTLVTQGLSSPLPRQDKTFIIIVLLTISWHAVSKNASRGVPN